MIQSCIARCSAFCNRLLQRRLQRNRLIGYLQPVTRTNAEWKPSHRHKKGGLYRVLSHGTLEADRSRVIIYDDAAGEIWVRSAIEFNDGRFEALPSARTL